MFPFIHVFLVAGWMVAAECAYRVGCYRTERQNPVHDFGKHVRVGYWLTVGVFACLYLFLLLRGASVFLGAADADAQLVQEFAVAAQYSPCLLLCVVPLVAFRVFFQRVLEERREKEDGAWSQRRYGGHSASGFVPRRHFRLSGTRSHVYLGHVRGHTRTFKASGGAGSFGGGQTGGRGAGRGFGGGAGGVRAPSGGNAGRSIARSSGRSGAAFGGGQTGGRGAGRSFAAANQRAAVSNVVVASARPRKASSGKRGGKKGKGNSGKGAAPLLLLLFKIIVWLLMVAAAFLLGWLTTHLLEKFAGTRHRAA